MKSLTRTAYRAIAAFVAAAFVMIGLASPAFADGATWTITNQRTGTVYTDVAIATKEAASGDTLVLGEGNYTLYKVDSAGTTKGKNLTFVGQGTEKTAWNIGALVPDPAYFGTEYNGDYSFDGAGTVTFENMTMRSGSADYLGFIRANKTVLNGCVVNGKTFYWGYESAEFTDTTFNAPSLDYAIWTYSSPTMTFNNCTFNARGKAINVYTDFGAGKHDITVNVNDCTFNSNAFLGKQALTINDYNMGDKKYILNITNSSATAARDNTTCSQLFGFGGKASTNNKGKTDVNINGELVWSGGEMKTHGYTDGEHEDNFVDQKDYVWEQEDDGWYCTGHAKCGYCGWPIEETVKATYTDTTNCTETGERVYTATFQHKCFEPQTKTEPLDPIGHDWDAPEYTWSKQDGEWYCTAKRVCRRDASHVEEETEKAAVEHVTKATCEAAGKDVYTVTFENKAFETQTRTVALGVLGHDWAAPEYTWSKQDGEWYCTAKRVCKRDASHIEEETVKVTVEHAIKSTCDVAGKDVYTATFSNKAFETQTKTVVLGILGHDWGKPEYSWAKQDGEWYCTAKRVCKRDASHVEEQTAKASVETTPATCLKAGRSVYTAKFDGDVFKTQTRTVALGVLGHDWADPEYSWSQKDGSWFCTAKRVCKRDASHIEDETVKATVETTPVTCLEAGKSVYTASFKSDTFKTQTKTEKLNPLDHDWGKAEYTWSEKDGDWSCTAKRICKRDASHVDEQTVKATVETTPATCTEAGKSVYTAAFDGDAFETQVKTEKIAALDHDWAEPEYSWSQKDGAWYCTAKRVCKRDASHVDEQTVKATVKTTPATCLDKGESVYTAKFDGDVFETQTKTEVLDALGHDWGEPEYSWIEKDDGWYCTAKRVCKRDASHVEKETVKAAYEVTTPATTEKEGEGTYTATFENEAFETQTKTESIDKLPVKPQEPAKPKDDKPSKTDKPGKSDKSNKQTLPGTGDSTVTAIISMLAMASICFAASAVISKVRK